MNKLCVYILFISFIIGLALGQKCFQAPANPEDRRTDKTQLTVASFNVEWLFLYHSGCPGSGCAWKNANDARTHLNNIANVLAELNADIVVSPEVESCAVLNELLATPALKNSGYKPYLIPGTDSATGQNVALLTRVDPRIDLNRTEVRETYPQPGSKCGYTGSSSTTGVSKHFFTELSVVGITDPILLIGLHFIAFPTTIDRCSKREAQATVIRSIIETHGLNKNRHVIVAGDYNDYDDVLLDVGKSVPNSRVLQILKGKELHHVGNSVTDPKTIYSSWYDKNSNCIDEQGAEHTLIDHILVSSGLNSKIKKAWFHHSFPSSCTGLTSDHWPVVVQFSTTEKNTKGAAVSNGYVSDHDDDESGVSTAVVLLLVLAISIFVFVFVAVAVVVLRKTILKKDEAVPLL